MVWCSPEKTPNLRLYAARFLPERKLMDTCRFDPYQTRNKQTQSDAINQSVVRVHLGVLIDFTKDY